MSIATLKSRRRKSPAAAGVISPHVKLWLEANGENVFCRGMAEVLEAVQRTHSIKGAAAEVGRSYRYIWARIKQTEEALGAKLVAAQVGGRGAERSELTPLAVELLQEFSHMRAEVYRLIDDVSARRLAALLKRHAPRR
jgi:molybdate transport system regulatory protein